MPNWYQKICSFLPQQIPGPVAILYDKVATPGLQGFHEQVAGEITSTLKYGNVLDVGTGPGHLLVEIARQNPDLDLTGCDLSRKMLKIAEQLLERNEITSKDTHATDTVSTTGNTDTNVQLVRADVQNLPFADNTFNLVVSTLSLHHWHNPAEGIRECLRVTAPGGQCWIYDLRSDVSAKDLAGFVTGRWLRRLILAWVFKFHSIDPNRYLSSEVTTWLNDRAKVQTEVNPAYLKLSILKADSIQSPHKAQNEALCS